MEFRHSTLSKIIYFSLGLVFISLDARCDETQIYTCLATSSGHAVARQFKVDSPGGSGARYLSGETQVGDFIFHAMYSADANVTILKVMSRKTGELLGRTQVNTPDAVELFLGFPKNEFARLFCEPEESY